MSRLDEPFERAEVLDKPGIVGARWWHKGLADAPKDASRRNAILAALGAVGLVGVAAAIAVAADGCSDDETAVQRKRALDMQRTFGWSFGAAQESVTFDGESKKPFDRAALARMSTDLRPADEGARAYYVPALFESPSAVPTLVAEGDPAPITPLGDVLRPIFTPAMDRAYRSGKALASLLLAARTDSGLRRDIAVIVDLDGPESVAFAAGAAEAFDPVFTFDNWPHPRGVVKAHLTLAAAAYYQPLFARSAPGPRATMFVLDRQRLSPYSDDATQFDNRHVAKLPSADALWDRGVRHVLYVVPTERVTTESDDLNDDLVAFRSRRLDVGLLAANVFAADPAEPKPANETEDWPPYYYGGRAASHGWFWIDYPWGPPPRPAPVEPSAPRPGKSYVPAQRATAFSSGAASSGGSPIPDGFGTVPVVVALGTGVILGAALSRSGSWNRASGGYGG
ncbi:hypothetical protein predicted by Glimmer/Critica [Sorangium cellulosum So ce56]|uniref:Uncharacterized protein n=1 Tax=Sorangium cellulosum (strain So ce56) TaxID=448385 RepID=A9GMY7_SORC5|nr:hypothetical protein [Sorangium cellulosum]CAN93504.1 hypothetical protein predicted by Glimmer/Critica [Sorangium cellulosum So ce56]